jgi:hypothetical protein
MIMLHVSTVTPEMLTTGHLSFDQGNDGVPFQQLPGGLWNYWHPGPNPDGCRKMDGLFAAEMRRRVELGHGSWKEMAVLYGFSIELNEGLYPLCTAKTRFSLVCERLSVELVHSIRDNDNQRTSDIMDVIYERSWYIDWLNREGLPSPF